MKYKALLILILISSFTLLSALSIKKDNLSLRCMLQMKNYSGHGAYIVISLLDENKEYKKTLRILGDDREWYNEIEEWWKFFGKEKRPERKLAEIMFTDIVGYTQSTLND